MKVIAAAALLFSRVAASVASEDTQLLLEPRITTHRHVIPQDACENLIALGEEEGFTSEYEAIDENEEGYNVASQSIEVFQKDRKCSSTLRCVCVSLLWIHILIILCTSNRWYTQPRNMACARALDTPAH